MEHVLLNCPVHNFNRENLKSLGLSNSHDSTINYILLTPSLWTVAAAIYYEHRSKSNEVVLCNGTHAVST